MSFRQSQSLLHTWSGLLLGWLLFLVFVTGTIAFWREGMNRWMRPELPRVERPLEALAGAQAYLQQHAPGAQSWSITMPSERSSGAELSWRPQPGGDSGGRGGRRNRAMIDGDGNPTAVRGTLGGDFFYRFHFDLHYMPVVWARWLVGAATMMMLVAILTGIVIHKRLFRDFFTLRRGKGHRSWLDGHNATAVLALPFHLMITYTGLVTLMALLMPWAMTANYEKGPRLSELIFLEAEQPARSGRPAHLVDLAALAPRAEARLGGPIGRIQVSEPGDAAARINFFRTPTSMLSSGIPFVSYGGVSGNLLSQSAPPGAATATAGAMIGLHAGRFADYGLRWIYFLCGVAGCLMVASGLVFWTAKRRDRLPDPAKPYLGFRLVERLNIAVVAGFPFAIAVMLWANRLLPTGITNRAEWEVHCLFLAWGAVFLIAAARRPASAWAELFRATGALLLLLPIFNALATERGLPSTLTDGDFVLAGVDLVLLVFGFALLWLARTVGRPRPATAARARRLAAVDPHPQMEPAQ